MHLLQSGIDITIIALWLGHESPATTHGYIEADLAMKENAMKSLELSDQGSTRFEPSDKLMEFLDTLWLCQVAIAFLIEHAKVATEGFSGASGDRGSQDQQPKPQLLVIIEYMSYFFPIGIRRKPRSI